MTAKPAKAPAADAAVEVKGSLDAASIRTTIARHMSEVKACYNQGLARNKALEGRVTVELKIAVNGTVSSTQLKSSTLNDTQTENCILVSVRSWIFPKPKGGVVLVTYPFLFKSIEDAPKPAGQPLVPPPT